MPASTHNISIERNANFGVSLILKNADGTPIDVTNATIDAEIKQDYYLPTLETFTITKTSPAVGQITLSLTSAQTAALHPGPLKYDVLIKYNNNHFQKIMKGVVFVDTNITTLS